MLKISPTTTSTHFFYGISLLNFYFISIVTVFFVTNTRNALFILRLSSLLLVLLLMLMTIAKGLFYALFFYGENYSGIFKFLFMTLLTLFFKKILLLHLKVFFMTLISLNSISKTFQLFLLSILFEL